MQHLFCPELFVETDDDGANPRLVGFHWAESYSQTWDERNDVDFFDADHPAAVAACAYVDALVAAGGMRLVKRPRLWRRLLRRRRS